jgi:hypothetical protein
VGVMIITWRVITSQIVSLSPGKEADMSEYRQCECRDHDDGDGFIGGDCPNEGRIKTARYGWLCAECYSKLEIYLVRTKLPMQAPNMVDRRYVYCMPKSLPKELESKPSLLNVKDLSEIPELHPETIRDWGGKSGFHTCASATLSSSTGTGWPTGSDNEKWPWQSNFIGPPKGEQISDPILSSSFSRASGEDPLRRSGTW